MTSRFDQTTEELTPEPMEVYVDFKTCPIHTGFHMISMPRNEGEETAYRVKCPLSSCPHGEYLN